MQHYQISTVLIQPCRVIDFLAVEYAASTDRELTMRAGLDGTLVLRTMHNSTYTYMLHSMLNIQTNAIN